MSITEQSAGLRGSAQLRHDMSTADDGEQLQLHDGEGQVFGSISRHTVKTVPMHAECVTHRQTWQRRLIRNLRITDTLVVAGAVFLGQYVRFSPTFNTGSHYYDHYYAAGLSILFSACWLIALASLRTRSSRVLGFGIEEYRRVVAASFSTFGAIAIVSLLLKLDIARGCLAIGLPIGIVGLLASRLLWRKFIFRQRQRGHYQTSVLIVGGRDAAVHFADEMTRSGAGGYRISGLAIPGYGPPQGESILMNGQQVPILGDENHVLRALATCDADTVAVAGTEHFGVKGFQRLIWDLEPKGVDLMVSTGVMDVALSRLVLSPTTGVPVMHIEKPQYHGAKKFKKRFFDIAFSVMALVAAAPIFVVAALAIKLTSRGPVFYSAERIGIDGRPFAMLKFRTMVEGADRLVENLLEANEGDGLLFKMRDDPRVTSVGRLLRRLSVDELPQFINALRGQMSVVGPRPPLRREVQAYDRDVSRRLLVKPGITGLWQVSGRSDLAWDEAVRLDLTYVDNWTMTGDVFIVAKTVGAVLRHRGAY